jgi:hypothetical protein
MESLIKVTRISHSEGSFNSYEILLDDETVGYVRNGRSTSISVNPGCHSLKLMLSNVGSQELKFDINPGEEIRFECEKNFSILQYRLFPVWCFDEGVDDWILLKRCE